MTAGQRLFRSKMKRERNQAGYLTAAKPQQTPGPLAEGASLTFPISLSFSLAPANSLPPTLLFLSARIDDRTAEVLD